MTLAADARLGPYQIQAPLGAGGMGEVYRARDTRLGRDVAIKVLPEALARDPGFRGRFEREARAIAALTHPHICTLYDVGHHDGVDFLVLELVDGETLAARLVGGPLPLGQALSIAIQIADALATAHRHGIIHRDVKPGNVMLTAAGAKLLDFGLARTTAIVSSAHTATTRSPVTEPGTVLGTLPYMAPEQVQGKEADARSDIWALGCVLHEMITGARPFDGESGAGVIAAILEREPPALSTRQPRVSPALDHLVAQCLVKAPDKRWQSVHDVLTELRWIAEAPAAATNAARAAEAPVRNRRALLGLALAAAVAAGGVIGYVGRASDAPRSSLIFELHPPRGFDFREMHALSPDDSALVAVVSPSAGPTRLWLRRFNESSGQLLVGSEGAMYPFWSPDSRNVGFFANGQLRRIAVSGGAVVDITSTQNGRGAVWTSTGDIIFAPSNVSALMRVPAAGGEATPFHHARCRTRRDEPSAAGAHVTCASGALRDECIGA